MAGERMLSTGQTAKRLGILVRTIYRWEDAGRLVPISRLPSGQRRFSSRDSDALLRSRVRGKERCAVYARVSSEKQAEAGNLGRQKDRLVAAATRRRPRDTRSRLQWQSGRPDGTRSAVACTACCGLPPRVRSMWS